MRGKVTTMTEDTVSELRYAAKMDQDPWDSTIYDRAADEIQKLRTEIALLELVREPEELGL
jgi:hypothetical protein